MAELYEELEKTTKRLEKTRILSEFLKKLKHEKDKDLIYLLKGRIFADYDEREIGISNKLAIKAVSKSGGISSNEIIKKWRSIGDLGKVAEQITKEKRQRTLYSHKLDAEKVMENIRKLTEFTGKGTVDKKIGLISELLTSASPVEAKYIVRTLIGDLRIGVGEGILRDAIVLACFGKDLEKEKLKRVTEAVQNAYDRATDFSVVFKSACKGLKRLSEIELHPGKPIKVMLALKVKDIEDGFKAVGKRAAFEYKYDGFRLMINSDGKEIKLFTRRLDDVTKQFPEVVEYVKKYVKGKSFIIDTEAVGYDPKTRKYRPFQEISQRIKRKYEIEKMAKELPVEVNAFDILYYNGKSLIKKPFAERRKLLERVVKGEKCKLKLAEHIVTDKKERAERFYKKALKDGEEGVMIKNLDAPYKPGARVGYMLKLKPEENDFDLVIIEAEYGTGKRAGWLSSFYIACQSDDKDELLGIGKVSTGLKEKEEQGLSFIELTKLLKPLIISEKGRKVKVKPKIVVSVTYQNIQKSPTYSSGFALRFPRITKLRPDRSVKDIAFLKEVKREYKGES